MNTSAAGPRCILVCTEARPYERTKRRSKKLARHACPVSCTMIARQWRRLQASACRAAWAHPQSCVCCRRSQLRRPALYLDLRTSLCNMLPCPGRHGPTWWPPPSCSWVWSSTSLCQQCSASAARTDDVILLLRCRYDAPGSGGHWRSPHHAPMEGVMVHAFQAARVGPQASEMIVRCQTSRSTAVYQHGHQPNDDRGCTNECAMP